MDGKICVVTGATSGIGKEAAIQLAALGATVALIGRNPDKGRSAVEDVRTKAKYPDCISFHRADFSSLEEVRELGRELSDHFDWIDVLINNAGAMFLQRLETDDGFEMTFGVNHLAPFVLTGVLLESLKAGAPSRVVNVASDAHLGRRLDFTDLQMRKHYSGMTAYGRSKLANIYFARALARRLEGTGITVNSLHPGFVRTGFGRNNGVLGTLGMTLLSPFAIGVAEGADTVTHLASSPDVAEQTGVYFYKRREGHLSQDARDDAAGERLWRDSLEMTGNPYPRFEG